MSGFYEGGPVDFTTAYEVGSEECLVFLSDFVTPANAADQGFTITFHDDGFLLFETGEQVSGCGYVREGGLRGPDETGGMTLEELIPEAIDEWRKVRGA